MIRKTTLARFQRDLEARGLKPNTVGAYLRCIRRFLRQLDGPPSRATECDLRNHLLRLRREFSPQTTNQAIAALRCFYCETLRRPRIVERLRHVKHDKRLPTILSGSEVQRLFRATRSPKYRALFGLMYGAGLRVSEACSLRVEDVDSKRMLLHVVESKGGSRLQPLSESVLQDLRDYYRAERPAGPLLFPGQRTGRPLTRAAVKLALRKCRRDAGIDKPITPHTLRHCYATHLLDAGADIRSVQVLLGHASVKSTEHYTKLSRARLAAIPSPLELLGTPAGLVLG